MTSRRAIFGPRGIFSTKLVVVHKVMLHTTYQGSNLSLMVSDKKIFSCFFFPYISLCKTNDPPRPAHFWPQGPNLNNFGRGSLRDATYKKLWL